MGALYLGLIALGLVDCLGPLLAHEVAGGQIPLARDLAQVPLMAAFLLSALAYRIRPEQRATRRLLVTAVATLTAGALGHVLSAFYLGHGLPAWAWLADTADLLAQQFFLAGWVALLAVFPDGKYQRRYEQWVVRLVTVGALVVPLLILTASPKLPGDGIFLWSGRQPASPLYTPSLTWLQTALPLPLAPIIGVVLLALRQRRTRASGPDLRWPLLTVSLFITLPAANALVQFGVLGRNAFIGLFLVVFSLATGSLAIGLMRYHLFDVELVIRRSLVYAAAWAAIAAVYIGRAAALGLATAQRYQVVVAILVTVAATIAFQPARVWLEHMAGRLVFGKRLTGYELLRELGAGFDQTLELESVGPRLAQAVADGLQASWVHVYVGRDAPGGTTFEKAGRAGLQVVTGQPSLVQSLSHGGELVGKIEVGPRLEAEYKPEDRDLLTTIGQQAALAIRNARLAAELAASRARLVQAQGAERRRLERDLHDGVQQQLVALMAGIRSARTQLARDPSRVDARMVELQDEAHQALKDLRQLVSGIHPAVLSDHGLAAAVRARTARFPIQVDIECAEGMAARRFGEEVESTAYFVISEGLTNVLKHSGSTAALVKLAAIDGHLQLEVRDDGRGFKLADTPVSGLRGLRDRVEALGGSLTIESAPGVGTHLVAILKIGVGGRD
jgi:signal transduction histidine kinase